VRNRFDQAVTPFKAFTRTCVGLPILTHTHGDFCISKAVAFIASERNVVFPHVE